MTGAMQVLAAAGARGTLTGSAGGVVNTSVATGIRTGTFALVNDGTFTGTGSGGGNWFTPTVAGIGSSWSARWVTNTSTTTTVTGTVGSFVSLSSGTSWGMSNTATNNEGTGTATISFSPDGGTTIAGTMAVSWDVGFTP